MPHKVRYWGKRFGRLVAQKVAKGSKWVCLCDCGNEVIVDTHHLTSGHTQSCGCYQINRAIEANMTHGQGSVRAGTATRAYKAWVKMKNRCYNPNCDKFEYYGGRGVTVCDEWRDSFEAFFAHMGDCPENLTLDRINPHGNYEPGNCRWATRLEQARNKR